MPYTPWYLSDLKNIPSNGLKVMSTFSCGGGSSLGYKLAGCDVIAANDIDQTMRWHYERNLQPKHFFECPIEDLITADLPDELFHLDILDGSPPCSTFTTAGKREKGWGKMKHFREGQTKQVLSELFFDYLALAERLQPKVIIAENVSGLLKGNAKGYAKLIADRLVEIGYRPQLFLIDAADCGVPQHRERTFFIALRNDTQRLPLVLNPTAPWISVADSCADLQQLTEQELIETKASACTQKWWPETKPGDLFSNTRVRLGQSRSLFCHIRLDGSRPSNTITSCARSTLSHWDTCRKLSLRELTRICSFPEDYTFKSPNMGSYLLGMSVPPLMMKKIASEIIQQWLKPID